MKVTSSLLTIVFTVQPKNNAHAITSFCTRKIATFLAPFCCSLSQATCYMYPCMITYCHHRVLTHRLDKFNATNDVIIKRQQTPQTSSR